MTDMRPAALGRRRAGPSLWATPRPRHRSREAPSLMSTDLFQPARLGPLTLPNRIVMAPLTRSRTGSRGIPGPMNAEYYRQRASAGLIIAEATQISPQGQGYAYTPGIHDEAQVAGWRQVTEAVHQAGGR